MCTAVVVCCGAFAVNANLRETCIKACIKVARLVMSLLTGIDNAPNAPGSELAVQLKVWAMMVMAAFTLEVTGVTFVFQFSAVSLLALIGGGITLVLVRCGVK